MSLYLTIGVMLEMLQVFPWIHQYHCRMDFDPQHALHMLWKMSLQRRVMFAKSMVKMIILLDIGVIVHHLHFELAVIFMLVILLH